jgi:unsaturated rhamnogalacturonyl hydrolase
MNRTILKYIGYAALLLTVIPAFSTNVHHDCTLTVTNPAAVARKTETVELKLSELRKKAPWLELEKIAVIDAKSHDTLVTQRLENLLLFQTNFAPREAKKFIVVNLAEKPRVPASLVDAKYILPRKDVCWENDRIAFRIYGGPLAGNVKNGLDVWTKRVRYPIMDKWYNGDSLKGKDRVSYHVDHGEGADMFEVGRSLGAGATAILDGDSLCQTGLFAMQTIAAIGPIRTQFVVTYENGFYHGKPLYEEAKYTLDAGQNLNRIDVHYSSPALPKKYQIVAGLVKRNHTESFTDKKSAWVMLWGQINEDTANGYLGTGVVFPKKVFGGFRDDTTHAFITANATPGTTLTYYAGAGWTRSGDFADMAAWRKYLDNYSVRLQSPLKISIHSSTR